MIIPTLDVGVSKSWIDARGFVEVLNRADEAWDAALFRDEHASVFVGQGI